MCTFKMSLALHVVIIKHVLSTEDLNTFFSRSKGGGGGGVSRGPDPIKITSGIFFHRAPPLPFPEKDWTPLDFFSFPVFNAINNWTL